MKVAGGHSVPLPSATKIKMDDRKRSLAADPEDAYPSKRQATSNGASKMSEMDMEADLEVPTPSVPHLFSRDHYPSLIALEKRLEAMMLILYLYRNTVKMPYYARCLSSSANVTYTEPSSPISLNNLTTMTTIYA